MLRRTFAGLSAAMILVGCVAAPPVPDRLVSERPISGGQPVYPARMQQAGREGEADVSCMVTVEGWTVDCQVTRSVGGSAFADAALDYVSHSQYLPATRNGVPYQVTHRWTIAFRLNDTPSPETLRSISQQTLIASAPPSKIPLSASPLVYPKQLRAKKISGSADVECLVLETGRTTDCKVTNTSNPAFAAPALSYVSGATYAPAIKDGAPVASRHQWTITFKPT